MDGVLHSNLRALTLAKTYHQYHAFLAAIISCSTAGNTTCQTLEELLGLIDPELIILRRFNIKFNIRIKWFTSEVYVIYDRPQKWNLISTYLPYSPYIEIQQCQELKCLCISQKEITYEVTNNTFENFTSFVYEPFVTFECTLNTNLVDHYLISVNSTCVKLTVMELKRHDKPCLYSSYIEELNFSLTIRPILPNEVQRKTIFQLPKIGTSNISKTIEYKINQAKDQNTKFWDGEIDKLQVRQSRLITSLVFSGVPMAGTVLALLLAIIALVLVIILWCQNKRTPQ